MEGIPTELEKYVIGNRKKMAGANPIHNKISTRIASELLIALDKKPLEYHVMTRDQQILIPEHKELVYSDVVVVCEEIEYYPKSNVIVNPFLVVEVLPSLEDQAHWNDLYLKYRSIPTLKEYVVVQQESPWVNVVFKERSDYWSDFTWEGIEATTYLRSIDTRIPLYNIYKGISF